MSPKRAGGQITPGPLAVTRRLNNSIVGAFLLLMTGSNDIRTPTMRL
jgi:hypothetical protein